MKQLLPILAVLSFGFAQAQTSSILVVDGRNMGQTTAYISGGQLMLPLTAFAQMGWKPLLDTENHIIDLARCLRLSTVKPKMWLVGGLRSIGVSSASALAPLPVNAQFRSGRWYLPAKAVAGQLLYTVNFDKVSSRVDITKPTDAAKIGPVTEVCLRNIMGQ